MKAIYVLAAASLTLTLAACHGTTAETSDQAHTERELIFFDGFDNGELDREKWIVVGTDFWVNREEQAYLDDPETIVFRDGVEGAEGGVLELRPVYRPGVDPHEDREADFVSGRLESKGKFETTYGRAEARIRLPDAEGFWPAFWMLGNGKWPDTGEIDIMEYIGEKDWTAVALHGPGYSGDNTPFVDRFYFPQGEDATGWHVYAVEWTPDMIQFEIDGRVTYRATRKMVEHLSDWAFDNPKYLILNSAIGGAYPVKNNRVEEPYYGLPQATAELIKRGEVAMEVDWVKVYAPLDAGD
ncbi:glycoside hydrolase family 16 protein [Parerythrobacter aestuarii]|uniref:glycoside hydrolase family 16 protein n=1 Tax=Parerythrobacter aestuarii TaxID=3020909 RepID=UPI0024DEE2AC|nr:glycoside hydrolase family 16 protein [Parerythrobacter aestuarii]